MNQLSQLAARAQIEDLRRLYAKATDLIGTGVANNVAAGREIYQQIFTPDVAIRTTEGGEENYKAVGPEEWVKVVSDALEDYCATQHLIGTQLVEFQQLEADASGQVSAGTAKMESYLQAWHENKDGTVWLFIGTYTDQIRWTGQGWQIFDMTLDEVSSDRWVLSTDK